MTLLFYSYSGKTSETAKKFAKENGIPQSKITEIKSAKKIGKLGAFLSGCPKAMSGKPMPILPINADDAEIFLFAPIWAGGIAPPAIAALQSLKKGTFVNLQLVSASGSSNRERNTRTIKALGLELKSYRDIKA